MKKPARNPQETPKCKEPNLKMATLNCRGFWKEGGQEQIITWMQQKEINIIVKFKETED